MGSSCDSHCCQSQYDWFYLGSALVYFDPRWIELDESFTVYLASSLPSMGSFALENYLLNSWFGFGWRIGGLFYGEKVSVMWRGEKSSLGLFLHCLCSVFP